MNDHSGAFPSPMSALPHGSDARAPALTGLREIAFPRPQKTERSFDVNDVWRIVRKWWWLIAAIVISCLLGAIALSLLVTPEYRAEAIIEVNAEGMQVVKMGELEPLGMGDREFLTTQAGLLRSRSLADRVVRSLNLGNNEAFADPEAARSDRDAAAVEELMDRVAIDQQRDSRLLTISVESHDPSLSATIANSYADNFIQANLERRFEATSYARNFLEQRIATVKRRLEESERQLVAYAQKQGIITLNVDSGTGAGQRSEQSIDANTLVSLNQALSEAKSERIAAEQRYRQAQQNRTTTEVLENPTVQRLSAEKTVLEAEYQEKLGIYKPDFPAMAQLRSRIDSLDQALNRLTNNVSSAQRSEYQVALAKENTLQSRVDGLKQRLLDLRERSIEYTILQREVDTNRSLYEALLQRFKEVGVAGGVGANTVSVVDRAQPPQSPFKPNLPLNIALGLVAGVLLGFGAAFSLEWIDDTIKSPDDLTGKLGIAPLGVIPTVVKGTDVQEELENPRSELSEAYHSVRTALQFSTDHGIPRSLLVTSTRASEGKSSTALALARTLASLGASVLLVDSDLRKPTFRGPSGNAVGLSGLLAGSDDFRKAVYPTGVEQLFLLPSGTIPPNPAELLASGRFGTILAEMNNLFDYVIIDGPPVLGLADAPLLSSMCEGTLMVIEAGSIRRAAALNAVKRLRMADAHIMGGILTKFSASSYGYGYGYGEDAYSYREGEEPKKQIELLKSS